MDIKDSFDDYVRASIVFPENFYIQLGHKLTLFFNNRGKRGSKSDIMLQPTILGNQCKFIRKADDTGSLVINNVLVPASGKGFKFVENAITSAFVLETIDKLKINRPAGRTAKQDRLELGRITGTFYPKLSDKVANASGTRDFNLKGNINKEIAVTSEQMKRTAGVDASKFDSYDNSYLRYYVKKGVPVHDLTDAIDSVRTCFAAILAPDEHLDIVARNPAFAFVNEEHHSNPYIVVAYQDTLAILEWTTKFWKVRKFVSNPEHIKVV